MVSDGEMEEGQVGELPCSPPTTVSTGLGGAARRQQLTGGRPGPDSITTIEPIAAKWSAFGWHVRDLDGHDVDAVSAALAEAATAQAAWPSVLICRTSITHGLDLACHRTRTGTSSAAALNWPRPRSRKLTGKWARPFMRKPPYLRPPTEALRPGAGGPGPPPRRDPARASAVT